MVIDLLIYSLFIDDIDLDLDLDLDLGRILGNLGWPRIHYVAAASFEVLLFLFLSPKF